MNLRVTTVFLLLSFSFPVFAENPVTGLIERITAVSLSSGHPGAGYSEFRLKGVQLDAPCNWLWFTKEDTSVLSILLTAQAQGKEVTVYYSTNLPSPWAPGSCGVTTVLMMN